MTTTPLELNLDNEQKYISYLLNENNKDAYNVENKYFLNSQLKIIHNIILTQTQNNKINDIDTIYDIAKQKIVGFDKKVLIILKDSFKDFSNIEYVKERIKEHYYKEKCSKGTIQKVLEDTSANGEIKVENLQEWHEELGLNIQSISKKSSFLEANKVTSYYNKTLERRENLSHKRSMGDPLIDKYITYAGESGDIMSIAMPSGGGKTTLTLNLINYLINSGVCVVYFSLDMGLQSIIDRLICIRMGLSQKDISNPDKSDNLNRQIQKGLRTLKNLLDKNFKIYTDSSLSLHEFDIGISHSKAFFKQNWRKYAGLFIFVGKTQDSQSQNNKCKGNVEKRIF